MNVKSSCRSIDIRFFPRVPHSSVVVHVHWSEELQGRCDRYNSDNRWIRKSIVKIVFEGNTFAGGKSQYHSISSFFRGVMHSRKITSLCRRKRRKQKNFLILIIFNIYIYDKRLGAKKEINFECFDDAVILSNDKEWSFVSALTDILDAVYVYV